MSIASSQRNVGQKPPSLPHAKACSNHRNLHGTLIYSAQFLHRQIMSIFTKQYQHITELPSLVQHDDVVHKASASVTISEVVGDIRWTRLRPRFFLYRASMIRLLLSLLALVSGFAVQSAPAQARLCGGCDTEIGVQATTQGAARAAVQVATFAEGYRAPVAPSSGRTPAPPLVFMLATPAVLIGIDRSRQ
jgi:hypothetical protein